MNNIYYWKGASGSTSLIDAHRNTIRRLLTNDYSHHDLELLKNTTSPTPIYSFRINQIERLLFTTYQGCLHVLEHLPTHDYANSRCFKRGVVQADVERHGGAPVILFEEILSTEPLPQFNADVTFSSVGLAYYNKQFLALSEEQDVILQKMNSRAGSSERIELPVVIIGSAGTGKSLIGLSAIFEKISSGEQVRCLYVSQEPRLVADMRTHWNAGYATSDLVDFLSYDELHGKDNVVSFESFERWFLGLKTTVTTVLETAEACYKEYRICSGFTPEHYCSLGERQSSVPREHRAAFYRFYEGYLRHLSFIHEFDPELNSFSDEAVYDFIVVDEAQNFSLVQNKQLARLAKDRSIVFCMDSHQSLLMGEHSPQVLLNECLRAESISLNPLILKTTHRCTQQVAEALSRINSIRQKLLGGNIDKSETSEICVRSDAAEGTFMLMQSSEMTSQKDLMRRAKTIELAVVTSPDLISEAKTLFDTPLVFTPKQIIGQEFHTVVVYQLLSDSASQHLLRLNTTKDRLSLDEQKSSVHLPKTKTKILNAEDYAPWIHRYFIAASRAKNTLVIVEERDRVTALFLEHLKDSRLKSAPALTPLPEARGLSTNWEAMARKQSELGHTHIVEAIQERQCLVSSAGGKEVALSGKESAMLPPVLPKKKKGRDDRSTRLNSSVSTVPQVGISLTKKEGEALIKKSNRSEQEALRRLFLAAQVGDVQVILNFAKSGGNLNEVRQDGETLACIAVQNGHFLILKTLKTAGVDLNQVGALGLTPALMAAQRGRVAILEFLRTEAGVDLNQTTKDGVTLAHIAAQMGHVAIFHVLKKAGVDLNQSTKQGFTPADIATTMGYVAVLEFLRTAGIDLNDDGTIALLAAREGHIAVLEFLRTAGVDLNQGGIRGVTPAHFAAEMGHVAVLEFLRTAGVDLNQRDKGGSTPAHLAAGSAHIAILEFLRTAGVDLNQGDQDGFTPAHVAAEMGHVAVLEFLRTADVDLNQGSKKGVTPAHLAAQMGHVVALEFLKAVGVNLNQSTKQGFTPADIATEMGHVAVLEFLRTPGIDLNQESVFNQSSGAADVLPRVTLSNASMFMRGATVASDEETQVLSKLPL